MQEFECTDAVAAAREKADETAVGQPEKNVEAKRQNTDWRGAVDALGMSVDEIRVCLDLIVSEQSREAPLSATMAKRFLTWYKEGKSITQTAKSMAISYKDVYLSIKNAARCLETAPIPTEKAMVDPLGALAVGAVHALPRFRAVPDNWFTQPPVQLGTPRTRPTNDGGDTPLAWQSDALCAQTGPEAFFPEKGGSTRDAKKICKSCAVTVACLHYALDNDERFGIWGGLNEKERAALRRKMQRQQRS